MPRGLPPFGTTRSHGRLGTEDSAENPVPVAMARAVQRLKPDLVAVELDEVDQSGGDAGPEIG